MSRYIIFAPHIDDEVIGCHSLLTEGKVSDVYYFFELFDDRVSEALNSSKRFGFVPNFVPDLDKFENDFHSLFSVDDIIAIPHVDDHHMAHKMINRLARYHHSNLLFYSVDMNTGSTSYYSDSHRKKIDLYHIYPSQKEYFDRHPQCYLFEQLSNTDIRKMNIFRGKFESNDRILFYEVNTNYPIPENFETIISFFLSQSTNADTLDEIAMALLDWLLRFFYQKKECPVFVIKMTFDNQNFTEIRYGDRNG